MQPYTFRQLVKRKLWLSKQQSNHDLSVKEALKLDQRIDNIIRIYVTSIEGLFVI